IFGPPDVVICLSSAYNVGPQEVGSTTCPGAALAHEITHACGDRIGIDHSLDRCLAVGCVGTRESARWPEACFASRGPKSEVGHPGQASQLNGPHGSQTMYYCIEQGAQDRRTRQFELPPKLGLRASLLLVDRS